MTSGIFELDSFGRKLFRPTVPRYPTLENVIGQLEPATAALREFDRRLSELDNTAAVGRLFARLDAVHSSGAEGSTTTFTELMEYESALHMAPDPDDAAVVLGAATGLEERLEHDDLTGLILRIHARLFERNPNEMLAASAGKLKTVPNYVLDLDAPNSWFGFTPPSSVPAALFDWTAFTLATEDGTSELVRQILSHWMIEHIHPVADGNGRIGRLLVPIVLQTKEFTKNACAFFGEAVHEDKSLYVDALKDARISGKPASYVRQILNFLRRTADANIARLDRLAAIKANWKSRFTSVRSNSVIHRLYPYAITKPVFTVGEASKELGVSFAAANTAAQALLNEGILSILDDASRNRLFHANAVLAVFDRFKALAPSPTLRF